MFYFVYQNQSEIKALKGQHMLAYDYYYHSFDN